MPKVFDFTNAKPGSCDGCDGLGQKEDLPVLQFTVTFDDGHQAEGVSYCKECVELINIGWAPQIAELALCRQVA